LRNKQIEIPLTAFAVRLVHRGGAVDEHELGEVVDTRDAIRTARTYLFVSPSAVAADVLIDGAHARRISRTDGNIDDVAV
jgi:hypothetical protein